MYCNNIKLYTHAHDICYIHIVWRETDKRHSDSHNTYIYRYYNMMCRTCSLYGSTRKCRIREKILVIVRLGDRVWEVWYNIYIHNYTILCPCIVHIIYIIIWDLYRSRRHKDSVINTAIV